MKTLKFFIIIVVMVTFAAINVPAVYAGNIRSVLRKYNVGIEQINTEVMEAELAKAVSEYSRVETEYKEKQTMIHTVELTARIMRDSIQANDINAASVDMQRKEDYLTALVNVDADLEKIFEAEKEYREAQRQLGMTLDVSGILASRLESLSIYGDYLPDTSIQDVEQAAKDLKDAKEKLAGASAAQRKYVTLKSRVIL